jgi:hypothetical protein
VSQPAEIRSRALEILKQAQFKRLLEMAEEEVPELIPFLQWRAEDSEINSALILD